MAEEPQEVRLSETDVAAFADKLDRWAESLPLEERGLLQLLLARAEATGGTDVGLAGELTIGTSPGQAASTMLGRILQGEVTALLLQPEQRCRWSTWSRGIPPT